MSSSSSLWTEKYRPQNFNQLVGQPETVELLQYFIHTDTMPHMIFSGSPGTGKTSTAHILVSLLFPQPHMRAERVLELNASSERGIKVIRTKVKKFVASVLEGSGLKVVILDEADALTLESQYALRRIVEDSSKRTRFIMICNYLNKIIQPLVSRCTVIHF